MRFPVLVNINISYVQPIINKRIYDINRAVLDLHYQDIQSFTNGDSGNCIVEFVDGVIYDLQITFEEMYEIYNQQSEVDERFKDDVDAYVKDNLNNLKIFKNRSND